MISCGRFSADFRGGAICLFRTHFLGWSGRFFHGFDGLRRLWLESPIASSPQFLAPPRRVFFPRPADVGRADTPCFPPFPARQASPTLGPNGSQDVPRGLIICRFGTQLRWLVPQNSRACSSNRTDSTPGRRPGMRNGEFGIRNEDSIRFVFIPHSAFPVAFP